VDASQRQVVIAPWVRWESRTPLPITVLPAGTVTAKSNVALSRGVSLTGNQPGEPCGSLTTMAPSSVGTQPSLESSGRIVSSWVAWANTAARPVRRFVALAWSRSSE
jgi:hypothetical protein